MDALAHTPFRARRPLLRRIEAFAPAIDVGVEPPIDVDGGRHGALSRRRVSLRWLCGTILVGLAGAGLIGAAISAAFDRPSYFAAAPEFAVTQPDVAGAPVINPRKGDRIVKPFDLVAAKHSFRAAVTVKIGAREVIRQRAFTRVETPLSMTSLGYSDQIPPFNPLRLLSQPGAVSAPPPDPGPAPDDAEVSFEVKDLTAIKSTAFGPELAEDAARAQVAQYMGASAPGATSSPSLPPQLLLTRTSRLSALDPAGGLAYASAGGVTTAPFSSIKVRMVPENVTFVPETATARPGAAPANEALVAVRHGETLDDLLREAGVPADQTRGLLQAFGAPNRQSPIAEGERVKLQFLDFDGTPASRKLARVSIYADESVRATAALDDAGRWTPVQKAPSLASASTSDDAADDDDDDAIRLYDSLFETALKQGVPRADIGELVRIFSNDVDFQAAVTGGDSFDVLYEEPDAPNGADRILYASIATHNQTFKYYRFRTPDDNMVDYYDQDGRATHKFLVREPLVGARLTSPFGARLHPILGYTRMHTGVDLAAPTGTPIYAAGNGAIIKAGRESGYGNRVEIQHANGYVTTYSHMSGFARGIAPGVHVAQGQVIGYLGMTGLATGPHLHYEVIVNGHFVDPLRVKLSRTRELDGALMQGFQQDRQRIEGLLAASAGGARVADDAN